jgi:hypothetical protein
VPRVSRLLERKYLNSIIFFVSIPHRVYFASRLDVSPPPSAFEGWIVTVRRSGDVPYPPVPVLYDSSKTSGDFLNVFNRLATNWFRAWSVLTSQPLRSLSCKMEALMANVRTGFVISDMHRTEIHPVRLGPVAWASLLEFTDNPILQSGAVGLSKLLMTFVLHICKGLPTGTRLDKGVLRWCPKTFRCNSFALTNEERAWDEDTKLHPTTFGVINYSRWLLCLTGGGGDYPFSDTAVSR